MINIQQLKERGDKGMVKMGEVEERKLLEEKHRGRERDVETEMARERDGGREGRGRSDEEKACDRQQSDRVRERQTGGEIGTSLSAADCNAVFLLVSPLPLSPNLSLPSPTYLLQEKKMSEKR